MDKFIQGAIILKKYQIIKTLGKGGFSKVYLASNLKLGNKIAIKVIDKSLYESQLLTEKEILVKLRHSSIVVIFDIEEDENYYYLIEEYIEGKTLEHLSQELNEEQAKAIFALLLDVFNFLHTHFSEPIIYRDLKPSNIMIMPNGAIKLIDFGIASPIETSASLADYNYGTKSYCAPEQVCYGTTDRRSDIYSLGVTMYYLLTGKNLSHPPYKILTIRHFRKDISKGFSDIISKMTQTLAAKRYQNISEIMRDFENINRADDVLSDIDFFNKISKRCIYVAGLKRGIGTTHITQMLAHFLKEKGKKVALLEWNNRDDFVKIAGRDDVLESKRFYIQDGIKGYFYSGNNYESIIEEDVDILLVDAGSYEEFKFNTEKNNELDLFLVSSASDWDIDVLEDMLFSNKKNTTYLVNLKGNDFVSELKNIFGDEPIYSVPFNENPYKLGSEVHSSFESIFGFSTKGKQEAKAKSKLITRGINEFFKSTKQGNKIFSKN